MVYRQHRVLLTNGPREQVVVRDKGRRGVGKMYNLVVGYVLFIMFIALMHWVDTCLSNAKAYIIITENCNNIGSLR